MSPLKAEFYSSKVKEKVAEEEVRDSRHRGVLRCCCWLQRWRGPHARECRGSLEIVSSPQLAASKEMKTSTLQLQRTEFCQQSERVWKRILLLSFQIRVQPSQHLDSELVRPQAENPVYSTQNSHLQNSKIINRYFFKQLNLWSFVTQHRELEIPLGVDIFSNWQNPYDSLTH